MEKQTNPQLEALVYKMRDPETNNKDFRETTEKIGEYLGIEIARDLETQPREIRTVLGATATHNLLAQQPVLIPILRAGIPLYQGLQRAFPEAEAGFIGAMRNEETLQPEISYLALPNLEGKTAILADTMIATGGSLVETIRLLQEHNPERILVAGAIAAQQGIQRIQTEFPGTRIYTAATDPTLNEKGYIVPGLGDAGDRCFGRKI